MSEEKAPQKASPFSIKALAVALVFGAIARVLVEAKLTIPIPGTGVVTDPREIFTTLGAGLSGPIGGLLVGILAGIREPGGIPWASLLAHVSGGLWMGLAYKKLVYERLQVPLVFLGWAGLVLVYYFAFAVPGFVIGLALFYPADYIAAFGAGLSVPQAYALLAQGAITEASLATLVTTLVMIVLPKKRRQPLW